MNKFLTVTLALTMSFFSIFGVSGASKTPKPAAPDFAFPATVTKNAEMSLAKALKSGDGKATVRALTDMALAQAAVGNEKLPPIVKRIEEIRGKETEAVTRSLLSLLLADIYCDIYQNDKWIYDRRELPLTPLPANYDEWSGAQFRSRIGQLFDEALANPEPLLKAPIGNYSDIITADRLTRIFYPTLYDFAAQFVIDKLKWLSPFSNAFSLIYLSPRSLFEASVITVPSSATAGRVLGIYADWLRFHNGDTAPTVNIDLQRISTVASGLYSGLSEQGQEKEARLLLDIYRQNLDSEFSGMALIKLNNVGGYNEYGDAGRLKEYASMLRHNIKTFPNFYGTGCLKDILAGLERRECSFSVPTAIAPGHDFKIKVEARNTPSLTLDFYSVSLKNRADNYYRRDGSKKLVKSVTVTMPGEVPYKSDTTIVSSLPDEGFYIAVARDDSKSSTYRSYQVIRSSRLSLGCGMLFDNVTLMAIDPLTGSPVADATILQQKQSGRNVSYESRGKTDANGFHAARLSKSGNFAVEKGTDCYASVINVYPDRKPEHADTNIMVLTDLSIYKPGDTIRWAAVAYRADGEKMSPAGGRMLSAQLSLANGTRVDGDTVRTDAYGRCSSEIAIPAEGLTGYAMLRISDKLTSGYCRIMVSDYKLPTFAVKVTAVDKNQPQQGDVTLRGEAMTYSGVAVAGGKVTLDLSVAQPVWWMRTNAVQFYSAEATTAPDGSYMFEIPSAVMEAGPAPHGFYTARVTVTSQDGESHQASREYVMGPAYMLNVNMPAAINADNPGKIDLKVYDGEGKAVDRTVEWQLTNVKCAPVYKGTLQSGNPVIDFKTVESGTYSARFLIAGNDSTTATTTNDIAVYRPDDRRSPSDALLWTPDGGRTVKADGKRSYRLLYATREPEQWVLCTLADADRVVERRWIKAQSGMHTLEVKVPDGAASLSVNLSSVSAFRSDEISVSVEVPDTRNTLAIVTETFRDRLVPGEEETWTLRTVDADSLAMPSAVMLNMFNAALTGIEGVRINPWTLRPTRQYVPAFRLKMPQVSGSYYGSFSDAAAGRFDCTALQQPEWQLYGRSFTSLRVMNYSVQLTSRSMGNAMAGAAIVEEDAMTCEAAAAPMMKAAKMASAESADEAMDTSADTGTAETGAGDTPEFEYRDADVTTAFFAPMLTTDKQGRLTYTFRVPNANTTWQFGALAYTDRMTTGAISRSITASKPVMVQPNLPRFLRMGDRAVVKATVMNNSEESRAITAVTETFDVVSGQVLHTSDTTLTLDANATATVGSLVDVPSESPMLGYRIKATSGNFADGEQTAIPVLPFTTPVIDTKPFYLPTDTTGYSLRLPAMPSDAIVTLQYCDNPTWYVVTALPGLRSGELSTSVDAASAIFSAAIADGLLRSNPAIARVLREWTASDRSDSTLTSMLSRNADLKTVLLNATPWMLDARSDTERMERLALLFDKDEVKSVYTKAIELLTKLRQDDGGFAWSPYWKESSLWATESLLAMLGKLNRLGFLPDNATLSGWIMPAMSYVERETTKSWTKYPAGNYTGFVRLCDLWPAFKPSLTGNRIIAQTVEATVANWKKYDIRQKALAASMLARHGHKATGRQILESMREYAVATPTEGMYWPSVGDAAGGTMWQLGVSADALEAFAELDPQSADIDRIRQWLILQKETRNWGSSATASEVIAAILGISKRWVKPAGTFAVSIGDRAVTPAEVEKTLGYFRTDISQLEPSGKLLKIEKSEATPAWGAVYCRYTDEITDVKPQSVEALSIERRLLKQVGTEWVETDDIRVGDRLQVLLTVRAGRDLQYVAVTDNRAACLEPVDQLPAPVWSEGVCFYRESRDSATDMFIGNLPKGVYQLSYEVWVNNEGSFACAPATAQSQYAPEISAHSGGSMLRVR